VAREAIAIVRRIDGPLVVGFAVAALASVVFVKLAASLRENDRLVEWDVATTRWLVDWRGDGSTSVMRAVTQLASPLTVIMITSATVVVLLVRRHVPSALLLVASTVGTALLVSLGKLVVARPRPPVADAAAEANGYSFPSGHAAQSVALYGALALLAVLLVRDARWRIVLAVAAMVLAFVVGLSRVVLGVHWLSDVVAGWALAIGWLSFLAVGVRIRALREGR
jgi:undecaprenyl-diphosphatase